MDFVDGHLCKLCVILLLRTWVLRGGVCPHEGYKSANLLRAIIAAAVVPEGQHGDTKAFSLRQFNGIVHGNYKTGFEGGGGGIKRLWNAPAVYI